MRPKKVILLVDANEDLLMVRRFMLETRGNYRVLAASGSLEALQMLEGSMPGAVDLLLCELVLPEMDGNELVRRAKQLYPELKAILFSATQATFSGHCAADAFLPKGGCSSAEMLERIKLLVVRKRGPKKPTHPIEPELRDRLYRPTIDAVRRKRVAA